MSTSSTPAGKFATETTPQMNPTLGHIVHFCQENGTQRAAIVVNAAEAPEVNLQIFCDEADGDVPNIRFLKGVPYSVTPKPGTWHWPDRV